MDLLFISLPFAVLGAALFATIALVFPKTEPKPIKIKATVKDIRRS